MSKFSIKYKDLCNLAEEECVRMILSYYKETLLNPPSLNHSQFDLSFFIREAIRKYPDNKDLKIIQKSFYASYPGTRSFYTAQQGVRYD